MRAGRRRNSRGGERYLRARPARQLAPQGRVTCGSARRGSSRGGACDVRSACGRGAARARRGLDTTDWHAGPARRAVACAPNGYRRRLTCHASSPDRPSTCRAVVQTLDRAEQGGSATAETREPSLTHRISPHYVARRRPEPLSRRSRTEPAPHYVAQRRPRPTSRRSRTESARITSPSDGPSGTMRGSPRRPSLTYRTCRPLRCSATARPGVMNGPLRRPSLTHGPSRPLRCSATAGFGAVPVDQVELGAAPFD